MKLAYIRYLKSIQSENSLPALGSLEFVKETATVNHLIGFYQEKSILNDLEQGSVITPKALSSDASSANEAINHVEDILQKISINYSDFVELFRLVINRVFCAPSERAGGGSTSSSIGVIWANFRKNWSFNDCFEFFVHELTHNLMFLDERRCKHYVDYKTIGVKENFAHSAILNRLRPLDKVLHSLVVATEICLARKHWIGDPTDPKLHPPTEKIISSCRKTIESIVELDERVPVLTQRGKELVDLCEQKIHTN